MSDPYQIKEFCHMFMAARLFDLVKQSITIGFYDISKSTKYFSLFQTFAMF
jgi:hypothetical protein